MAAGLSIRDAAEGDESFILALNAACMPAVSEMSAKDLAEISGWAHRVLVAEDGEGPLGFLILIRPGSAYPSDNYAWFEAKFDHHLYVDRIAVSDRARGKGVGRALYDEAVRIAQRNGDQRVTCEVNEQPPNPESMAFHARLGFRHLHSRPSRHGKIVAMLERPL
jgi:predicted GNAT superfamily acetyltransferase